MKKNVLIFPSGAENAMEIYDSLKYNLHFNLFGLSSKEDHTSFLYSNFEYGDYDIRNEDFIFKFNEFLKIKKIDYVFPTHDSVALFLMENENSINSEIVCSPLETAVIARSKIKIYENLKEEDFIPSIYHDIKAIKEYPVFIKPDIGAGSQGCKTINTPIELENVIENQNMIVMEYLPSSEYTVDCFTDKNGKLLFVGPRERIRVNMGISFKTKTIECSDEFYNIAKVLNTKFKFRGCWFFQVKKDKYGKLKLMEFSVRYAGTMALYRELGINFALLTLFDRMNYDLDIIFNNYNLVLDRRLKNSYKLDYNYNTIYLDFDDTLIVNNAVNTTVLKLIYQAINKNKKVILLTKHEFCLKDTMKRYRIHEDLFDQVILINDNSFKYEYIDNKNSIFIDNYFIERKYVREKLNIPVFDVDAVECLLEDNFS